MPSLMIHLAVARGVYPDAGALLNIGTLAPDAVSEWHAKDRAHLRDVSDREWALRALADRVSREDSFAEGVLLHLFVDSRWDADALARYRACHAGDEWIKAYRNEIALASAWLYRCSAWSESIWRAMAEYSANEYGQVEGASAQEVSALILRNQKWHAEADDGPSPFFPPDYVDRFVRKTACEYRVWRGL